MLPRRLDCLEWRQEVFTTRRSIFFGPVLLRATLLRKMGIYIGQPSLWLADKLCRLHVEFDVKGPGFLGQFVYISVNGVPWRAASWTHP